MNTNTQWRLSLLATVPRRMSIAEAQHGIRWRFANALDDGDGGGDDGDDGLPPRERGKDVEI